MLREAIFAAFIIVDVAHTVRDKRRRHRARKAQQEYLQQRTLQLQAAAAQGSASRPQRSFLQRHGEDVRSLAVHACLLALALLGITVWARDYLQLGACVCAALLCIHGAALHQKQIITKRRVQDASLGLSAKPAGLPASIENLNGTWIKDKEASDSMEPAMDLMQLNGLIRKAINLVTGVQIHVSKDVFEFAVTSVIPGFKIKERYLMNGESKIHRRRDLRRGGGRGKTSITADGELRLSLVWDDPHGGNGYDLYHLVDYNTLHIKSLICVENGTVTYNVMYRRKA